MFVANPDEEIGSPVSTPVISAHALTVDVGLVMEGARANGDIVSSRKGIADFELRITGRAAHAGVEPEKGRSAVLEAAHKIDRAPRAQWPLAGRDRQRGCGPGWDAAQRGRGRDHHPGRPAFGPARDPGAGRGGDPGDRGCQRVPDTTCEVVVMGRFWPMEKLERSGRLVDHAVDLAGELGFPLRDAATGGASDANTIAGLGVPAIDGLGPIGGSDHAPAEYLEVDSIVPRTVLLAGIILALGRDPVVSLVGGGAHRAGVTFPGRTGRGSTASASPVETRCRRELELTARLRQSAPPPASPRGYRRKVSPWVSHTVYRPCFSSA